MICFLTSGVCKAVRSSDTGFVRVALTWRRVGGGGACTTTREGVGGSGALPKWGAGAW